MAKKIPTTKQEAIDFLLPWIERQLQRSNHCFLADGYNPHPEPRSERQFTTIVLRFMEPSEDYYFWVKITLPEAITALATHDEDFPIMICNLTMHPRVRNYAKLVYKELVEQGKNRMQILGHFLTLYVVKNEDSDGLNEIADTLESWIKEGEME